MNDLFAALSTPQLKLLEVVWEPMRDGNRWPNWNYVESEMYSAGFREPEQILREMPAIGGSAAHEPQYSAVWFDRFNLTADSVVALTLAASIHLVDYRPVATNMIDAIKLLVARVKSNRPSPYEAKDPIMTAKELRAELPGLTDSFIEAFPKLLNREPFSLTGTYNEWAPGDVGWSISLRKSLLRYDKVASPREYVERVEKEMSKFERPGGDSEGGSSSTENSAGSVSGSVVQSGVVNGDINLYAAPVAAPQPVSPPRVPGRGFYVHMLTALIASPSDTRTERDIIEQVVLEVNADHMRAEKRGLLPMRYERDAVTRLGARPQAIVNETADAADIVVALFRTRIGTPTAAHPSGTVEEVMRAVERGVPVHIFFLDYGVNPSDIDPEQYGRLREWREQLQDQGLYDVVASTEELRTKVRHYLGADLRSLGEFNSEVSQREPHQVSWTAAMERDSSSSYTLVVTPSGSIGVDDVRVQPVKNARSGDDMDLPHLYRGASDHAGADRLLPGQPMRIKAMVSGRSTRNFNLELSWKEEGQERQEALTVTY